MIEYPTLNRSALIIKIKQPFVNWVKYHDPEIELQIEGFDTKNVYLIPNFEEEELYDTFLKEHFSEIFEEELCGWFDDPETWPQDRSWKIFQTWFNYEIQTVVIDMLEENIVKN